MACPGLETIAENSITALLSYPNLCDYYFYAKLMAAFFIILTFILFQKDKQDPFAKGDMLSSAGVAAIATIFLSGIGTLLTIIPSTIFIEIMVAGFIFIILWILKR